MINDNGSPYFNLNLAGILLSVISNNIDATTGYEIFVGSSNGLAYLVDNTGAVKWNYEYSGYAHGGMLADDLDNDGKPELIISHAGPHFIAYYDDNLELKWTYPVYGYKFGIADINNDNFKEIVVLAFDQLNYTECECAFTINGSLLFKEDFGVSMSYTYESKEYAFLDYDDDGYLEILFAGSGFIQIVNYTGAIEGNITIPNGDTVRTIALADINNDSQIEVITGCTNGKIYVLELNGTLVWSFSTGGNIYDIEISDIDLDGGYEIVVGSVDDKIYVITSSGGLKWSYTASGDILDIEITNLDDDTKMEIIASTGSQSRLFVFEDTGVIKWYRDFWENDIHHVSVGDFNDDSKDEIVCGIGYGIYVFSQAGKQLYYSYEYVGNYFDVGVSTGMVVGGGTKMPRVILARYINASLTDLEYNIIPTKTGTVMVNWTIDTNDRILYQEVFINGSLYQTLNSDVRSVSLSFSGEAVYNVSICVLTTYFDAWLQVWVIYDKTPPSFDIISPVDKGVVPATVGFDISFSDNLAGLGNVTFYLNNTRVATYCAGTNISEYKGGLYTNFTEKYMDLTPNTYHSGYDTYYEWELSDPDTAAIYIKFYRIYLDYGANLYIYDAYGRFITNISGWIDVYGYEVGWISGNKVKFVIDNPWGYWWEVSIDGYYVKYPSGLPEVSFPSDGYWDVTVVISDAVGNVASKSVTVRADVTPPNVIINLPDRCNITSSSLAFNWSVNDYWTGVDHYLLRVNVSTTEKITVNVTMRGYNSSETRRISHPNAVKIRIHFARIYLDYSTVKFYIKDANGNFVANFTTNYFLDYRDYMSPWITGNTVYLEVYNPDNYLYDIEVDYYEVMCLT
ncbi:MAG: hypothetical protein DRP74_08755, partial [Candidatus Omnitrophota bacterium]